MSESAQYHVCLAYDSDRLATSDTERRIRQILIAVWVVMVLQALVFVHRYALTNPYVDEWEFVPALFGEEPAVPWLWRLHNEHRFPLPRVLYLVLFQLTGDLRTGCYVSLAGMAAISWCLMLAARKVRGRASWVDATFPLLLLHAGQDENLYMGYQICFMLTVVLAVAQFLCMIFTTSENQFQRGLQVGLLGTASLMCGAGGLAYGSVGLAWVGWLAITGPMPRNRRLLLLCFAFVTPIYLILYRMGYERPSHHPPSAGIWRSVQIGLEAQSMALGPNASRLWPGIGAFILIVGCIAFFAIGIGAIRCKNRPQWLGILAQLFAAGGVAFGIGWGRSGFVDDMGFAWRYGWITAPGIISVWFAILLGCRSISAQKVLGAFAIFILGLSPINIFSGFRDAERRVLDVEINWKNMVLTGSTSREIAIWASPDASDSFHEEMRRAMRILKRNRYTYYEHLREDDTP